ncbi:MAG: glucose-1-phosphate cytidylyltransferase [Chlamydiales bacterium]|jgi:glucose-1-phosphate cytidylyltransferase
MKTIILAGGRGARLGPLTIMTPKPMIEIGGDPILVHIMRRYAKFGYHDFAIALGFKGEVIKRYIIDHGSLSGYVKVDFKTGEVSSDESPHENWEVELIDTGAKSNTGARVRNLSRFIDGRFMLTYGDGLADVDIAALVAFHESHGKLATLTAVRPLARFGHLQMDGGRVARFSEKSQLNEGWINGGFFVLEPEVLDLIPEGSDVSFEVNVLQKLAADGQLMAYQHNSFWQCMDTVRDREVLEALWETGDAPWI